MLAPQISYVINKFSNVYLNSLPKQSLTDSMFELKRTIFNRPEDKYSRIIFLLTNFTRQNINSIQPIKTDAEGQLHVLKNILNKTTLSQKEMSKNLLLFRSDYGINECLENRVSPYINRGKELVYKRNYKQNILSYIQIYYKSKIYSVIKTYISKPEIKYSSHNVSIDVYMYNRKNRVLFKNLKKSFSILKFKYNRSTSFNFSSLSRINKEAQNVTRSNNRVNPGSKYLRNDLGNVLSKTRHTAHYKNNRIISNATRQKGLKKNNIARIIKFKH